MVSALKPHDSIGLSRKHVNDFTLAFIAPLGAYDNYVGHRLLLLIK
jgi:hypothetical protein